MNYQRIYDEFISDRLLKQSSINGYYEKHHIIPKSLGGADSEENVIKLTAQDHYFAHALLAKIHGGAMWRAYWMMSNSGKYKASRLMYDEAKKKQSIHAKNLAKTYLKGRKKTDEEIAKIKAGLKKYFKENPPKKGFKRNLTECQRRRLSESAKKRISENGHPLKGKPMPKERVEKIRNYMLSEKNHFLGKPKSEEHKRKIGMAQIGALNHAYKKQTYLFKHKDHGVFIGTQNQLMHEFKLLKGGVSRLCLRKYKQHKGWVIVEELEDA